ncbi:hypothetical protein Y032_0064g3515 [Ancylostoma ceylanicum]|nr:hypothetical protein Y032_0064g3515 [Ancylostoma ceylanicum]
MQTNSYAVVAVSRPYQLEFRVTLDAFRSFLGSVDNVVNQLTKVGLACPSLDCVSECSHLGFIWPFPFFSVR